MVLKVITDTGFRGETRTTIYRNVESIDDRDFEDEVYIRFYNPSVNGKYIPKIIIRKIEIEMEIEEDE